ncbi:hypothetical protein RB653_002431 [Dictyostelium firmibasis]|uniref:Uncharacterized protein n=1 Tax=Dictyostelium firmibasis TaxID=79012 RepID=A0AAN7YYP7_9MYCE
MKLNAFHIAIVIIIVSAFSVSSEEQSNADIEYTECLRFCPYYDESLCKDKCKDV